MKELADILMNDIQVESFTQREMVKYGVVYPAALIMICLIVSIF